MIILEDLCIRAVVIPYELNSLYIKTKEKDKKCPNIPTPHIEAASKDEIAKVVLMPGDPLRARKIAETYLKDAVLFNQVRGMLGYTGNYKGKRISVMGSGMGLGVHWYLLI